MVYDLRAIFPKGKTLRGRIFSPFARWVIKVTSFVTKIPGICLFKRFISEAGVMARTKRLHPEQHLIQDSEPKENALNLPFCVIAVGLPIDKNQTKLFL